MDDLFLFKLRDRNKIRKSKIDFMIIKDQRTTVPI